MKIAITGYGTEGKASYGYYKALGHEVVIADERPVDDAPEGCRILSGDDVFGGLGDFDLIIRSPGINPGKLPYGDKVWSATNEFFEKCPAPIIGVTGTKGKGTTSSLVASILRSAGLRVHLVGNIGVPALEVLPEVTSEDIVVYELSSFQLWDIRYSPHVAVVLMIEPDHLDVHDSLDDYISAKARICEYQITTDRTVFNGANEYSGFIAKKSVGQRLPYPSEHTAHVQGDSFFYKDTELCGVDELQIVGDHNRENACAAIAAAWPWVQDPNVIAEGLRGFSGLPHRLKFVREVRGVKYYDDSIATTPGSAIAAIQTFRGPKIIILGGSDKGAAYDQIVMECKKTDTIVLAIGQTGNYIEQLCHDLAVQCERVEGLMNQVVQKASELSASGDTVILSPASASFDQYKNYADRGEQFVAAVNKLQDEAD